MSIPTRQRSICEADVNGIGSTDKFAPQHFCILRGIGRNLNVENSGGEIALNHLLGGFLIEVQCASDIVIMCFGKWRDDKLVVQVDCFNFPSRSLFREPPVDDVESLGLKVFAVEPLPVGELVIPVSGSVGLSLGERIVRQQTENGADGRKFGGVVHVEILSTSANKSNNDEAYGSPNEVTAKIVVVVMLLRYFSLPLLLLISFTTLAQQPADDALRQKAYRSLESLAQQLDSLKSGENRARLGSNIAYSLWPHNEPKARELFAAVAKEIKAGLQSDNESSGPINVFLKLREDTALRIAEHDPEWAVRFLSETSDRVKLGNDKETALNLRLALTFVQSRPDLALELGRESTRHGFSDFQLELLFQLQKKSPDQAVLLFKELLKIFPYQDFRHSAKSREFGLALARIYRPRPVDRPAFNELMKYFIDVGLESHCERENQRFANNDPFCHRLGLVVHLMEKADPKRAAPMKHLARKGRPPYEWAPELWFYAFAYQSDSLDELKALVPEFTDWREVSQSLVIRKLTEEEKFAEAHKLMAQYIWIGPRPKEDLIRELERWERIATQDTSAELLKESEGLRSEGEQFFFLYYWANEIGSKNRETSRKLLDRARAFLEKVPNEKWQTQYRIGVAAAYCKIGDERCFTMMDPVIRSLNEMVVAGSRLNDLDNNYLRNGEWTMTAEGGVGSLLTLLAQNAVYFGLCDFDRAIAVTAQFNRPEIRLMAQLKLAQGVLTGPPKRTLFPSEE